MIHVASPSERGDPSALCGAAGVGLAFVDPKWAARATCEECRQLVRDEASGIERDQVAEFPWDWPRSRSEYERSTPCETHRRTGAELERLIQSTTTADELTTFGGDQRELLQAIAACPDCKAERDQKGGR